MFNNRFSRILPHPGYNIGGGVGEAALIGAAFGGAKALVTGEDPLKAALLGGVTGGAMSGVTAALPLGELGSTAAGEAVNQGVGEAVNQGITSVASANPLLNVPGTFPSSLSSAVPSSVSQGIASAAPTVNTGLNVVGSYPSSLSSAGSQGIASVPATQTTALTAQNVTAEQALAKETAKQAALPATPGQPFDRIKAMVNPEAGGTIDKAFNYANEHPYMIAGGAGAAYGALTPPKMEEEEEDEEKSPLAGYDRDSFTPYEAPRPDPYPQAQYTDYFKSAKEGGVMNSYAEGGIARFFPGGTTRGQVDYDSSMGQNDTQGNGIHRGLRSILYGSNYNAGRPLTRAVAGDVNPSVGKYKVARVENPYQASYSEQAAPRQYTGPQGAVGRDYSLADSMPLLAATNPGIAAQYAAASPTAMASGGIAGYNLGGYAAGGNPRLLKGPGDGMSDNIPATIGDRQPARLADGEFVVPADVVSHLGNGSTDAGAKHLYAMMDKVRKARTGNKKQGKQIKPQKYMPA